MTRHHRIGVLTALALLWASTEALAQFPFPRPKRPLSVPTDNRATIGLTFGPSARTAESDSSGFDVAVAGEIPLHDGLRGRVEVGGSSWSADPVTERGATRVTLTRATIGAYRLTGTEKFHTFSGGGVGLFRHRVRGASRSGTHGGIFGGVGMEYLGDRRGFGLEFRVHLTGKPSEYEYGRDLMLHGAVLFSVKRVF